MRKRRKCSKESIRFSRIEMIFEHREMDAYEDTCGGPCPQCERMMCGGRHSRGLSSEFI